MEIVEIIERISKEYRKSMQKENTLTALIVEHQRQLNDMSISHKSFVDILEHMNKLNTKLIELKNFNDGLFAAREIFLNLS